MNYFPRTNKTKKVKDIIYKIKNIVDEFYADEEYDEDIVRLHSNTLGNSELIEFIRAYMEGNITMSEINKEYEDAISRLFGSKYSSSCNSGSSANLLAISSLIAEKKIRAGDKIIVPSLAWSTTIFPLTQHGLIPVFIDQSIVDFNIDLDKIKNLIESDKKIKGIMAIHTYGIPINMAEMMDIVNENELILIEDTCESMGATFNGKKAGTFGEIGTFSTYYSHHICTLEGGIVITNDQRLDDKIKSIRSHGWTRGIKNMDEIVAANKEIDSSFLFINEGYNLRLSDPQAAIGKEQVKKLNLFTKKRNQNAEIYKNCINNSSISKYIKYPQTDKRCGPSWFGFPILISDSLDINVKGIRDYMKQRKVETRPFLCGDFTKQPVMKQLNHEIPYELQISRKLHSNSLALPCHQDLTQNQIETTIGKLEQALWEQNK